jgi:hypothetical protein
MVLWPGQEFESTEELLLMISRHWLYRAKCDLKDEAH